LPSAWQQLAIEQAHVLHFDLQGHFVAGDFKASTLSGATSVLTDWMAVA
jgi:hypothetical protein